jgi:DNA mismatch repair protein MutS
MTPLMEQYNQICEAYPKAIVLIRVGDFFEAYGEPAKHLAETLGLTLTERDGTATTGIPHHLIEKKVTQLVARGQQVILMDQSEDPRGKSPGEVQRHRVHFGP